MAGEYVARGYVRLNRDERGGALSELAAALDDELATASAGRPRQHVSDARRAQLRGRDGGRHGFAVRCVWLDTPLAQAQVNLVERMLERFGTLPDPG